MLPSIIHTSAYGASSSSAKPGILDAVANCATFEDKPFLPQSYFCVVGIILKTGVVEDIVQHYSSDSSG